MQHYKDRHPPWIKLYNDLPRRHDYSCLQDDSKLVLISLFLLASCNDNKIPYDLKWIQEEMKLKKRIQPVIMEDLATLGWISVYSDDSKMIAGCKQDAIPETETETEKSREEKEKKTLFMDSVYLTTKEHLTLKERFGETKVLSLIEDLDNYIGSTGKRYKSHYKTILAWEKKNGRQTTKTGKRKSQNPSTGDSEDGGDFKTTSAIGRTVKV